MSRRLTLISADAVFKEIVTQTKPSDFPSLLRQKLSTVQTVERHKIQTEATTSETCEKCGRTEVRFSAVQLRGADEGSTIFFTCDCGHKYVVLPSAPGTRLLTYGQMERQQLRYPDAFHHVPMLHFHLAVLGASLAPQCDFCIGYKTN